MLSDIIIIIPTHKRQHYLNRVAWYYSHFDMQVYICDSTPETAFEIDKYDNINYLWCPDKTFYTKILFVLNTTDADFYATSPDDDFLKYETLLECYKAMKNDRSYSMGVGGQIVFDEHFENKTFRYIDGANAFANIKLEGTPLSRILAVFSNYQNLLWSLFRKDVIAVTFTQLIERSYSSQNFIELSLAFMAASLGNIYLSNNYLNFRESTKNEHWGKLEKTISLKNIVRYGNLRKDSLSFVFNNPKKCLRFIGLFRYLLCSSIFYQWKNEKKDAQSVLFVTDDAMASMIQEALLHS